MTTLIPIALFGWVPLTILIFAVMPARRAVLVAFIGGWLFLPVYSYDFPVVPEYTKTTAICLGIILGVVHLDAARLVAFRPKIVDLPMGIWCLAPLFASLANDLGLYDGLQATAHQTLAWGVPYFIGRLYFSDLEGLRELAVGLFVGGLVYAPFCLFEARMSPVLHQLVYGVNPETAINHRRLGGWRPEVFVRTGLSLGMFMTAASLCGVWLWRSRTIHSIRHIPVAWLVPALLVTTVICRSLGALMLLVIGVGALMLLRMSRTRLVIVVLAIAPVIYCAVRATDIWSGDRAIALFEIINEDRAASLKYRLDNEEILIDHAIRRPIFGWGGWDRSRPSGDVAEEATAIDGLWILSFGKYGLVGLAALLAWQVGAPAMLVQHVRPADWTHPKMGGAAALAMLLLMYAVDNLLNAIENPTFVVAAGGLWGTLAGLRQLSSSTRTDPHSVHASPLDPSTRRPAPEPFSPRNPHPVPYGE